jgi:hypothetical protein
MIGRVHGPGPIRRAAGSLLGLQKFHRTGMRMIRRPTAPATRASGLASSWHPCSRVIRKRWMLGEALAGSAAKNVLAVDSRGDFARRTEKVSA